MVEHNPNDEDTYGFVSDDTNLEIGDFVICDTCYGESYGRIVDIQQEDVFEERNKCRRAE